MGSSKCCHSACPYCGVYYDIGDMCNLTEHTSGIHPHAHLDHKAGFMSCNKLRMLIGKRRVDYCFVEVLCSCKEVHVFRIIPELTCKKCGASFRHNIPLMWGCRSRKESHEFSKCHKYPEKAREVYNDVNILEKKDWRPPRRQPHNRTSKSRK
jgi:hypothetical protein